MTASTILIAFVGFEVGLTVAWVAFDFFFYRPLANKYRKALEEWKSTVNVALTLMSMNENEKGKEEKDGMILSPFQVKRFGKE